MKPLEFPLLADENIHPDVVSYLRRQQYDIRSIVEDGLFGQGDLAVLRTAYADGRAVLTHDSDFGTLAITQDEPFISIIYLRPGHIRAEFTIQTLRTIAAQPLDVWPLLSLLPSKERRLCRSAHGNSSDRQVSFTSCGASASNNATASCILPMMSTSNGQRSRGRSAGTGLA